MGILPDDVDFDSPYESPQPTSLREENQVLYEALKHIARVLSYGGDAEILHYAQATLEKVNGIRNQ